MRLRASLRSCLRLGSGTALRLGPAAGGGRRSPTCRYREPMKQAVTLEQIRRAPKVLLHDHLDGGLRPATVVELAREVGYDALPTYDEGELATWFTTGAARQDLILYLETFAHTVAVMQTKDALVRVASECAQDLAADGVVYAEVRFAPELHI